MRLYLSKSCLTIILSFYVIFSLEAVGAFPLIIGESLKNLNVCGAPDYWESQSKFEPEHVCHIAALYNVTCTAIKGLPIDQLNREYNMEREAKAVALRGVSSIMPYLIEPNTHRIWFTSTEEPQEVPLNRLEFYNKSLQFYVGKPFKHHFWCNDKSLIPETIETIKNFNLPIIIHEITEIEGQFINKNIFKKLMKDKMFAFASKIARQEILFLMGGLYADVGMEQLEDLESFFRKFELIFCVRNTWVDNHFFAMTKGSPFFFKSLSLMGPLMRQTLEKNITVSPRVDVYLETRIWQLIAAKESKTSLSEVYFYEGQDYLYHGFGTWVNLTEKVTVSYLALDDYLTKNN